MRKLIPALLPLFAALSCVSCLSIDKDLLSERRPFNEENRLNLSTGYDIAHMRADLRRNIDVDEKIDIITGDDGKPKVIRTVKQEKTPYHYVGLYFGEGIMLDINGNLSLDLYKFYKLDEMESFGMRRKASRAGEGAIVYEKDGDYFERRDLSLFGAKVTAQKNEDGGITILDGILKLKHTILVDREDVVLKQFGLSGTQGVYRAGKGEYRISTERIRGKFSQPDDKTIIWDKELTVTLQDDGSLLFTYQLKPAGVKTYTFVRTEKGCLFFDKNYRGTEVSRDGDVITVRVNGRTAYTYTMSE